MFLLILSGVATYHCVPERFEMREGDTLSFDAKLPHGFAEIGGDHVEFMTASSRPD